MKNLLVPWPTLLINHNFLNQIMMILNSTYHYEWKPSVAGQEEDTALDEVMEKYATKIKVILLHMLN